MNLSYLLILILPITLAKHVKRQITKPVTVTSTTVPPVTGDTICTIYNIPEACFPISQCSDLNLKFQNGIFLGTNITLCGWDAVNKEPHVICCGKYEYYSSSSTITTTTTTKRPQECARIKTSGGIIWERAASIFGGTNAGKNNYPYMAALFQSIDRTRTRPFCGASIISTKVLLTAAHCFYSQDPESKFIAVVGDYILGSLDDMVIEVEVKIERYILHPQYTAETVYHDIALVILNTELVFSPSVTPVCLPTNHLVNETFYGQNSVVTGWGQDAPSGRYKTTLQEAKIPVVSRAVCQTVYSTLSEASSTLPNGITKDVICAGLYNDTRKDACQGDSGGPLVTASPDGVHWIQIGVVAAGVLCGSVYPGLYTSTVQYLDWINSNMVQ